MKIESSETQPLRRVLILADESAAWRVAGLRQLDRLSLCLQEFARTREAIEVCVFWDSTEHARAIGMSETEALPDLSFVEGSPESWSDERGFDLVLSTRLFLHRESIPALRARLSRWEQNGAITWGEHALAFAAALTERKTGESANAPWQLLADRREIPACERKFLRGNGKSQDGLVSRHLNRRVSRAVSRWLLKLPLTPNAWSLLIFALPIFGSLAFLRGTYLGFVLGCAVFQLYSMLDGCDGEIARAKFLQSEFGRRLDSFLDLVGNLLLALAVGFGLAHRAHDTPAWAWFYLLEGIAVAVLIVLSEGIVFFRRTRSPASVLAETKWNGTLYQRHHEFLERSGILFFGDRFVYWLVQLTKRDMAMLAFLILALVGWPQGILHLLFIVAGVNSILAGNAYLRPVAPRFAPETS